MTVRGILPAGLEPAAAPAGDPAGQGGAPGPQDDDVLRGDETEAVGGPSSPLRRCIVTGTVGPKAGLVRFVVDPEDRVVVDVDGTLPGRGYWVTASRVVLAQALKRNAFARAARRPVRVAADLVSAVDAALARRCLELLGLARRAGQAVAGFEKARDALTAANGGGLVLAATDGAEDGRRRIAALAGNRPVVALFDAAALGSVFGRDTAVHVVVRPGGLATRLLGELRRLEGVRTDIVPSAQQGESIAPPTGTGRPGGLTTD